MLMFLYVRLKRRAFQFLSCTTLLIFRPNSKYQIRATETKTTTLLWWLLRQAVTLLHFNNQFSFLCHSLTIHIAYIWKMLRMENVGILLIHCVMCFSILHSIHFNLCINLVHWQCRSNFKRLQMQNQRNFKHIKNAVQTKCTIHFECIALYMSFEAQNSSICFDYLSWLLNKRLSY